ncbi:IclR family transcriptional regulator [Pacificoceanicola onchidii]|uniref:IclR family transcriptional regulator n=1 Tax=Pacificoceanicola onchidii TaxID=2562685 RepID=UPI0010A5B0C5|nr:IclR family transcriptional regulator [Pacificoceanicola onchidii]
MADAPPNKTLARGLDVLDTVLHANKPMRLKDVAQSMDMDMASAHRVLRTLEISGYLVRGGPERTYGPGKKIWSMAHCLPNAREAVERLHPLLQELTERTRQVAHLGVLEKGRVVLADVVLTSTARISVAQSAGDTEDVYCSAIGKALAAFAPNGQADALLDAQSFYPHTEFTIAGRDALRQELERVRKGGIAFDDREGSLDVACIAAPICDPSGCSTIAIGISTIANSLSAPIRDCEEWVSMVKDTAKRAAAHIL